MSIQKTKTEKMSTLSSPNDVKEEDIQPFLDSMHQPPLSDEQAKEAVKDLNDTEFISKYNKNDRLYTDPGIGNQDVCLVSFIPSKDAKPDIHGIYGMMKVRGSYGNDQDAQDRAEFLLKNVDSTHKIYHAFVGKPFPLTEGRFMASERAQVDVNKTIERIAAHDTQRIATKEKTEMQEIEERRKQLEKEIEDPTLEPLDDFITQKVSRSNCLWMYVRCMKKVEELRHKYAEFNDRITKLDNEHPEFKDEYKQKYADVLAERDITPDYENITQYFDDEKCVATGITELRPYPNPLAKNECCDESGDKCCDGSGNKCCDESGDKCCDESGDKCCDDGEGEGETKTD